VEALCWLIHSVAELPNSYCRMARRVLFIALLALSPVIVLAGVWKDIFNEWINRGNVTGSQLHGQHVRRRAPSDASAAWLDEGASFIRRRNHGLVSACQGRNSSALKHAWEEIHTLPQHVRNAI
jgi:transposase